MPDASSCWITIIIFIRLTNQGINSSFVFGSCLFIQTGAGFIQNYQRSAVSIQLQPGTLEFLFLTARKAVPADIQ